MRWIWILIGMLIPSIVSAQAAPFEAPKVRSRVVISEVMWAGSEISSADEWLEIANISDEEINLEGWTITKRASDGGNVVMISFPEDAIIGVGELYLIANYDTDQSTLETSPDLVTTAVSLSNTKLYLQLIDTEGEVIDAVDDGVGAPFAGGKTPFVSMERIDLFASGEDRENWRSGGGESEECEDCEEGEDSSISSSSSLSSFSSPSSFSFVRITEVLLDPEISEDYEWIELGNLGEESVDITGWILSDGSRSHTIEPRSQSGYILEPGEHTLFFHYQTGIALSNQGEIIVLRSLEREIDRIDVSETGEEISFGREPDGSRGPFCIPTPREPNAEKKLNPQIEVQSGRSTDYTKVTLNLKAVVDEGSLKDAVCFWNFDDGTTSEKCNPPSHSWDYYGVYDIELRVMTRCGNEIVKGMEVVVLQKKSAKRARSAKSSTSVQVSSSLSSTDSSFSTSSTSGFILSSSKDEQKSYSIKSSQISSKNPVDTLPIRYRNIYSSSSSLSSHSSLSFHIFQPQPQSQAQESGLPWVLLFSQSAIWVILAGKRLL